MAARELAAPLPHPGGESSPSVLRSRAWWPVALTFGAISVVLLFVLFATDAAAAVSLWIDIPTYNYCFLIPLISGTLVWRERQDIARHTPVPSLWGIPVVALFAAAWWIGNAVMIAELRQLAIVGMLQGLALGVLGARLYRRLSFPLLFLFLMVPTGTVLLTPLQNLTTLLSSHLLRLAGLPVFVEGNVIEVPHGVYLVAPGCAGLNFLLAALSLSLLFARMVYNRTAKRVAAVVLALLISVGANQLRIFGIIWIAEITERQVDIVNDHLVYGWVLFSLVILACMALGLRLADAPAQPRPLQFRATPRAGLLLLVSTAMLGVAGAAQAAALPFLPLPASTRIALDLPEAIGSWHRVAPDANWSPEFAQPDAQRRFAYVKDGKRVEVFVAYYWRQGDGHKATSTANDPTGQWTVTARPRRTTVGPFEVNTIQVARQPDRHRQIWSWYWLGGHQAADPLRARLLGVVGHLTGDARAAAVVLAADETPGRAAAEAALADFLSAADGLQAPLRQARLSKD